ncbi:hypothetical protein VTJ83DRAFT_2874 [Remersonia thermophila]|uniref:Uncharacterized protein n=1 Tax=Remersonia thermophila TaxID=72144 RepID=A0ABR4DCF9_9PEZI
MRIRPPSALPLLLAVAAAPSARGAIRCFFPNGDVNPEDVPCDPGAPVSMCCGSRDACLSSGLCLNPGTGPTRGISFARGTCTDQTWKSPICPQKCRINQDSATNSSAYNFGAGGVQVWECIGQGYEDPGAYCCESAREKTRCCETHTAVFTLPGASIGNALPVQTFPAPGGMSSSRQTSNAHIPAPTSRTTSLHAAPGANADGNQPTDIGDGDGDDDDDEDLLPTTSLGTATAVLGASPSSSSSSGGGGMNDAAKIGLGVGAGVGVTLLIAVAVVVGYQRAKKAVAAQATAQGGGFYTGGGTAAAAATESGRVCVQQYDRE